jgi:hypothetical protein
MKDISFLIEEWKVSKYSCFQFFISIFTLRSYRSFHVEEELIKNNFFCLNSNKVVYVRSCFLTFIGSKTNSRCKPDKMNDLITLSKMKQVDLK